MRPKLKPTLTSTHTSCFLSAVQMMPMIQVTCAKRSQGHQSFWRANRASGIVKETF